MSYIIAVDGGGTKTAFCISDLYEQKKSYVYTGSTNYKSVGIDEAKTNLESGLKKLMVETGIKQEEIEFLVFGLSGCDSNKDYDVLKKIIEDLSLNKPYHLCNDAKLVLYSACDLPGIVVIAGTGSIALGVNSKGEEIRAGGWGHRFSDLGSGYWIGQRIIEYTLMYCDGCFPYNTVFSAIKSYFGIKEFKNLPLYVTANDLGNDETAALAKIVIEWAEQNDKLSYSIVRRAAFYLAQQIYAVYKRLGIENEKVDVVMAGGVLKSDLVRELLKDYLLKKIKDTNNVVFKSLKGDPVDGGIKLGLQCYKQLKDVL